MKVIKGKFRVGCCEDCLFMVVNSIGNIECHHSDHVIPDLYTKNNSIWEGSYEDCDSIPGTCPLRMGGVYICLEKELESIPKRTLRILEIKSRLGDKRYTPVDIDFKHFDFSEIPQIGDVISARKGIYYKVIRREFRPEENILEIIVQVD